MKWLVTGASGFTGRHLSLTLRRRGYDVRAFVRDASRVRDLQEGSIEVVEGDLTDPRAVDRAVAGCDVVCHIAALYRQAKFPDSMYWLVNVEGTRNVLDAAERHGVKRVVHCSTVGVHGDVVVPADESAPFDPGDIYQQTKLEGEKLARERFANGLAGTIVRPTGIYGPGDTRFLKLFRAIERGTFRMIGDGHVYYHLTYIDDLVEGIILGAEHPNAVGRTYILGGPRYTTLDELVRTTAAVLGRRLRPGRIPVAPVLAVARITETLCRPLGIEPPLHARRVGFFVKNRGFCIERAMNEIGFSPSVDLQEGLERTARWYREQGLL